MNKYVGLVGLSLISVLSLIACGGGSDSSAPAEQDVDKPTPETPKVDTPNVDTPITPPPVTPAESVTSIQGLVSSAITDLDTCQLYLYDQGVAKFADAFDATHASFKQPDVAIAGSAPIATATINAEGKYSFTKVSPGDYQVVLNCIIASGVQDESLLTDDPIQYQGFIIPSPDGITPNLSAVSLTKGQQLTVDFVDERIKPNIDNSSDVTVSADITASVNYQGDFYDIWNTINRISPANGVVAIDGLKANIVRMLGGVNKTVDGKKVPDLDYDVATYNQSTQQYEYNFQPLLKRIDAIVNKGKKIHQLVLDQPPWAFQTGYTFIAGDKFDGKHFLESQRVSHYGNSLPPKDKAAYHDFLKATMQKLIDTYGKELVLSWRFRVGSEIETPDHWYGTEQDFVEHFANSVKAIRAVLPEAKIGLHTRGPNFVYKNGTVTNYKGEPIKSFHTALIEYCYDNNIKYDFWGISDYPFINNASTRDPKTKFKQFFEPLVTNPKWQQGTVIDVEEYGVITKMGGVPGYAYITANSPQADTFNVALTDEFLQQGVDQIFQWGLRNGDKPWHIEVFANMSGQPRVKTSITTDKGDKVDTVGSIVVSNTADKTIQAVTYHYDPLDIEAINDRDIRLAFVVDAPAGTNFSYRKKLAAPEHHAFNSFMRNAKASTWLINTRGYDKYGNPDIVLNATGKATWEKYQHTNHSQWSQWQTTTTVARDDGKSGSVVLIDSQLPLFSFEKTEIKF